MLNFAVKSQLVNKKDFYRDQVPFLLFLGVYIILLSTRINFDFWNDELYTLENFVFVPISKTLTDYHVPNNHVLFNLISNVYLKMLGITSMHELMDHPYILRIISLLFAIITSLYIYRIGNHFFSKQTGLFAILLLTTTIPFYNFALQARGYGMSTMLGVLIAFQVLTYLNTKEKKHLILCSIFTFFLIYTIPSNLYLILGILIFLFVKWLIDTKKNGLKESIKPSNVYVSLTIAIVSGLIICGAAYSVIFTEVFNNPYLKPHAPFLFSQLSFYVPTVCHDIVSFRYFMVLMALVGILIYLVKRKNFTPILLFDLIIITPFLMFYIRGDNAPVRTFVPYIPYFILLFAIGIGRFSETILKTRKKQLLLLSITTFYCFWAFNREEHINSRQIKNDILNATRTKAYFYTNYFSHHYQPLKDIKHFKTTYFKQNIPVVLQGCEPHGAKHYLNKFQIPYFSESQTDSLLLKHDSIFIITNHFRNCPQTKDFTSIKLDSTNTYHNTILCSRNYGEITKYTSYFVELNNDPDIDYTFYFTNNKLYNWGLSQGLKIRKSSEIVPIKEITCSNPSRKLIISDNEEETWNAIGQVLNTERDISYWYQKDGINILPITYPLSGLEKFKKVYSNKNEIEVMNKNHEYSSTLKISRKELKDEVIITFHSNLKEDQELTAILSGKGENTFWQGQKVTTIQLENKWKLYTIHFKVPKESSANQEISAYLWNNTKTNFSIKNLTIYTTTDNKHDMMLDFKTNKVLVF